MYVQLISQGTCTASITKKHEGMEMAFSVIASIFIFNLITFQLPLARGQLVADHKIFWHSNPLWGRGKGDEGHREGFYSQNCPQAEHIAAQVVSMAFKKDAGVAAGLLRIHFHDCFVNGCDASILLDSTPSGEPTEKTSPANALLRGLEVIDEIKARLEMECPAIVSCADIITFSTRDGLALSGLPYYSVPGGRRDGLVSRADDVLGNLPSPSHNVEVMKDMFQKKGLTLDELVVLAGGHSIGRAHCPTFAYRVKNYSATHDKDPKLADALASQILSTCQAQDMTRERFINTGMPFDSRTEFVMDNDFYRQLLEGNGLIESDQNIAEDPRTRALVRLMGFSQHLWAQKFVKAMIRMGSIDAKTGQQGEIRRNCRFVN